MTSRSHSLIQIYSSAAALWQSAGAEPLDGLQVMLEMLALVKSCKTANLVRGELTRDAWKEARHVLASKLSLPAQATDHLERFADLSPGLVEQTHRAVTSLAPIFSRDYTQAFLNYLVHAPQTGLRRAEVGIFTWPDYLALLFPALLGRMPDDPVYIPFDSSGWLSILLAAAGWSVDCELRNAQTARVILLFAFLGDWKVACPFG